MPGNVQTRICAVTAQHSLVPISFARTTIDRLCSLLSPVGEQYGISTFRAQKYIGLGACQSTEMPVGHEAQTVKLCLPHPVPFWFKRDESSHFRLSQVTVFKASSHMFTLPIS